MMRKTNMMIEENFCDDAHETKTYETQFYASKLDKDSICLFMSKYIEDWVIDSPDWDDEEPEICLSLEVKREDFPALRTLAEQILAMTRGE